MVRRSLEQTLPDPYISRLVSDIAASSQTNPWTTGTLVGVANAAHYVPVTFPVDCTLYAMYAYTANTTGNFDLAFYDGSFNRLASKGSTAMAVGVQTLTLPEIAVPAGDLYYGAIALSNSAGTILRIPQSVTIYFEAAGCAYQTSAFPLPNPATPAAWINAQAPVFAFGVR